MPPKCTTTPGILFFFFFYLLVQKNAFNIVCTMCSNKSETNNINIYGNSQRGEFFNQKTLIYLFYYIFTLQILHVHTMKCNRFHLPFVSFHFPQVLSLITHVFFSLVTCSYGCPCVRGCGTSSGYTFKEDSPPPAVSPHNSSSVKDETGEHLLHLCGEL